MRNKTKNMIAISVVLLSVVLVSSYLAYMYYNMQQAQSAEQYMSAEDANSLADSLFENAGSAGFTIYSVTQINSIVKLEYNMHSARYLYSIWFERGIAILAQNNITINDRECVILVNANYSSQFANVSGFAILRLDDFELVNKPALVCLDALYVNETALALNNFTLTRV